MKKIMMVLLVVVMIAIVSCAPSGQSQSNSDKTAEQQKSADVKTDTKIAADSQADVKVDANVKTGVDVDTKVDAKVAVSAKTEATANTDTAAVKDAAVDTKSDATEAFKTLLNKKAALSWKVVYNLQSKAMGNTVASELTQYVASEKKIRMDVTAQGYDTRSYFIDDVLTACTKNNDAWKCYTTTPQKDDTKNTENDIKAGSTDYTITAAGTKVVAGVTTDCYLIKQNGKSVAITECFSSEHVPLYIYYESKDVTSEMTASSYSTNVDASAFVIPAESTAVSTTTGGSNCAACNYLSGEMKDSCLKTC